MKIHKPTEEQLAAAWRIVARFSIAEEREIARDDGRPADNDTIRTILGEEFTKRPWEDYFDAINELMEEEGK